MSRVHALFVGIVALFFLHCLALEILAQGDQPAAAAENPWGVEELLAVGETLTSEPDHGLDISRFAEMLRHVDPTQVPQLSAELRRQLPGEKGEIMTDLLYTIMAASQPREAWESLLSLPDFAKYGQMDSHVPEEYLRTRPREAFEAIQALKDRQYFESLLKSSVTRVLAKSEPLLLWEFVSDSANLQDLQADPVTLRTGVLEQIARHDFSLARKLLEALDDPGERSQAILKILPQRSFENFDAVGIPDLPHALELAELVGNPDDRKTALFQIIRSVANSDPQTAAGLYEEYSIEDQSLLGSISQEYARTGQQAAFLAWIEKFEPDDRKAGVNKFARELVYRENRQGLRKAMVLEHGGDPERYVAEILDLLADQNPREALAALEAEVPEELRGPAYWDILYELSQRYPGEAARKAQALIEAGQLEPEYYWHEVLPKNWAQYEPQKAVEWARALPEEIRHEPLSIAIQTWQDYEPTAAANWLKSSETPEEWYLPPYRGPGF